MERNFEELACEDSRTGGVQSDRLIRSHRYSRPHPSVRVSFARSSTPRISACKTWNARSTSRILSRRPSLRLSSNNYNNRLQRTKHWTKKPRRRFRPWRSSRGPARAPRAYNPMWGGFPGYVHPMLSAPAPAEGTAVGALAAALEAAGEREGELKVKLAESQKKGSRRRDQAGRRHRHRSCRG